MSDISIEERQNIADLAQAVGIRYAARKHHVAEALVRAIDTHRDSLESLGAPVEPYRTPIRSQAPREAGMQPMKVGQKARRLSNIPVPERRQILEECRTLPNSEVAGNHNTTPQTVAHIRFHYGETLGPEKVKERELTPFEEQVRALKNEQKMTSGEIAQHLGVELEEVNAVYAGPLTPQKRQSPRKKDESTGKFVSANEGDSDAVE